MLYLVVVALKSKDTFFLPFRELGSDVDLERLGGVGVEGNFRSLTLLLLLLSGGFSITDGFDGAADILGGGGEDFVNRSSGLGESSIYNHAILYDSIKDKYDFRFL
jgi:hypothetical protein